MQQEKVECKNDVHIATLCSVYACHPIEISQVWINQSDIILVGLRDYQDTKADVILKYSPDEARSLKAYGELPENGSSLIVSFSL